MKNYTPSTATLVAIILSIAFLGDAHAMTFDFLFTGDCDDCAFTGDPNDGGFDPLDDGLTQSVTGVLTLNSIALGGDGLISVDSNTFESFSYGGSNLLNPFSFDDFYLVTGKLNPNGSVSAASPLRIGSSDGTDGPFDFGDFCTATGISVLGEDACLSIGLVEFELNSSGEWVIESSIAFDVGSGGQLSAVPLPLSLPLLLSAVAALGVSRRRR